MERSRSVTSSTPSDVRFMYRLCSELRRRAINGTEGPRFRKLPGGDVGVTTRGAWLDATSVGFGAGTDNIWLRIAFCLKSLAPMHQGLLKEEPRQEGQSQGDSQCHDHSHDVVPMRTEIVNREEHREVPQVERIGDQTERNEGFEFEEMPAHPPTVEDRQEQHGAGHIDPDESAPVDKAPVLGGDR